MAPDTRDRFRALCSTVAAMNPWQREQYAARMPGLVTCEGRVLSMFNHCLLASQSEIPLTIVGGFRQWLKTGRCVRKGEHGLMIWFPRQPRKGTTAAPEPEPGEQTDTRTTFMIGYVFDVTQTEPLP